MEGFSFSYLEQENKKEIIDIRKESYRLYYGNHVNLEGLNWNNTDQNSTHLCFKQEEIVVSYLRLTVYNTVDRLENATLLKTPTHFKPPIALLARAATKREHCNLNLHNILRYIALKVCIANNISVVLGSLEERSSRLKSLLSFGYEVYNKSNAWRGSYIQSQGPVVLIGLDSLERIESAMKKMMDRYEIKDKFEIPKKVGFF